MTAMIPNKLQHIRTFVCREVHTKQENEWVLDMGRSGVPLDTQVQKWIDGTQDLVISASPPNVQVYQNDDKTEEYRFLTLSVIYVRSVEVLDGRPA